MNYNVLAQGVSSAYPNILLLENQKEGSIANIPDVPMTDQYL